MKKLSLYLSVLILWSSCDNNPDKKPLEIDFEYLKQKIQFGDEIIAVNDWDLTKTEYCDFFLGPSVFNEESSSFRFRSQKDSVFTL